MLPGCSFWKKSKTPCWPGRLPVTSDVHAGGVSGGMIERSSARAPRSVNSRRRGINPLSMYGSRIVNVAPSRPIQSGGPTSHLLRDGLPVLAYEDGDLRHRHVALLNRALAELVEVLGEWEAAEALLDHGAEHDDLERLEAQVRDEPCVRTDLAVVLPVASELIEQIENSREHRRVGRRHARSSSSRVVATIRSPSRRVCASSRRPAASTVTRSLPGSTATTSGLPAMPLPTALPAASLAHQ